MAIEADDLVAWAKPRALSGTPGNDIKDGDRRGDGVEEGIARLIETYFNIDARATDFVHPGESKQSSGRTEEDREREEERARERGPGTQGALGFGVSHREYRV